MTIFLKNQGKNQRICSCRFFIAEERKFPQEMDASDASAFLHGCEKQF